MNFEQFVEEYCDKSVIEMGGGGYFLNKKPIHSISNFSIEKKIETSIEDENLKEILLNSMISKENTTQISILSKFFNSIYCVFGEGKGLWLINHKDNELLFYYSYTLGSILFGKNYENFDGNDPELLRNFDKLSDIINNNSIISIFQG